MMIRFVPAQDRHRYLIMDIRNTGREFMTHHTELITAAEQDAWWFSPNRSVASIWVVEKHTSLYSMPVGFCMLRYFDNGRVYGTLALLPEHRGQGIGTEIYKFMMNQVDELWIDVRNDNVASMNAALKAGFEVHYIGPEVTELVAR